MSQTSRYAAAEYVRNLWDQELNIIYAEIHKAMDENAAESLRHEEVEWIKRGILRQIRPAQKDPVHLPRASSMSDIGQYDNGPVL